MPKNVCHVSTVSQVQNCLNILKLSCRPLAFASYKAFLNHKKKDSLPASFSAWFLKKNIALLYPITWPNFIVWLPLLREVLGNMCVIIVFKQAVTSQILKLTWSFELSHFFYIVKKSTQKLKYLKNEDSFYRIFYHFERDFIEANKVFFFFLEGEGPTLKRNLRRFPNDTGDFFTSQ